MIKTRVLLIAVVALFTIASCKTVEAKKDTPVEPAVKSVRLTVPGADCASTGAEADTLLRQIEGVSSVDVDIENTTADIKYDTSRTSIESIKEIMKNGDYPVTNVVELE